MEVKVMYRNLIIIGLFILILLAGCGKSEEEIITEAYERAKEVFLDDSEINYTYESNTVSLYLPDYLTVIEEDANNLILRRQDLTYIIFINDFELPNSVTLYNLAEIDEYLLFESFEKDDQFGFIRILQEPIEDNELYEIQVGIGGVKITANIPLERILTEATELMKVAKSIIQSRF